MYCNGRGALSIDKAIVPMEVSWPAPMRMVTIFFVFEEKTGDNGIVYLGKLGLDAGYRGFLSLTIKSPTS